MWFTNSTIPEYSQTFKNNFKINSKYRKSISSSILNCEVTFCLFIAEESIAKFSRNCKDLKLSGYFSAFHYSTVIPMWCSEIFESTTTRHLSQQNVLVHQG